MTHESDKDILDVICTRIERRFDGVVAKHSGFATPRLQLDDGYHSVEVFCVPSARRAEVEDACYDIEEEYGASLSMPIAFALRTEEETVTYFKDELDLICSQRHRKWRQVSNSACQRVDMAAFDEDEKLTVADTGRLPLRSSDEGKWSIAGEMNAEKVASVYRSSEPFRNALTVKGIDGVSVTDSPYDSSLERAA